MVFGTAAVCGVVACEFLVQFTSDQVVEWRELVGPLLSRFYKVRDSEANSHSSWHTRRFIDSLATPPCIVAGTESHMSALDTQIGGDHYTKLKIQPMEYSMANKLDACQHTVIKYVTRFRDKGGIADLEKAKHTIDLLIEIEKKSGVLMTSEEAAQQVSSSYMAAGLGHPMWGGNVWGGLGK